VASPFGRSARISSTISAISLSVIRDIQLLRVVEVLNWVADRDI
jgi:hypothetical protein